MGASQGPIPQCPDVPLALVEYLERAFPDKLPSNLMIPDRELWGLVGAQKVISHLRTKAASQVNQRPRG